MITRTYTYQLTKEGLKGFVEQKKGESEEAYKSRRKDIWTALKDYEDTVDEEELDESIVEEAIEEAVGHVEERDKEVLTFVFDDHPTLKLTIAQWREFEDYKGPGALKSSTTDDEGNQYNIFVKPECEECGKTDHTGLNPKCDETEEQSVSYLCDDCLKSVIPNNKS
jgi:hypothetical protein